MRIGEAAALVGVATHVLRHWEDEAVVVPGRTASGHREYSEEDTQRLRIVRAELDAAEKFLSHVRECRHGLVTRCEDCSAYATSGLGEGDPGELRS